ncbi:MAG: tetratricopeptide repeat protein [Bacteroidales bacterium]
MRTACISLLLVIIQCVIAQTKDFDSALRNRQYEYIVKNTSNFSTQDSSNLKLITQVAQAYEGLNDYRKAYQWYEQALKIDPNLLDIKGSFARVASLLGKKAEAKNLYLDIIEADSNNYFANYQLASILREEDNHIEALEILEKIAFSYPSNISIQIALADCYLKINDKARAIYSLAEAHRLNPENDQIAENLSNLIFILEGDPKRVIAICDTTLGYNPESIKMWSTKGKAYFVMKEYDNASKIFRDQINKGDLSYTNYKYLGASLLAKDNITEAADILNIAYKLNDGDVENSLLFAKALTAQNLTDSSAYILAQCEQLIEPPKNIVYEVLKARGDIKIAEKKYLDGLKLYDQSCKLAPNSMVSWNKMLQIYNKVPDTYTLGIIKGFIEAGKNQRIKLEPYIHLSYHLKKLKEKAFFENKDKIDYHEPNGNKGYLNMTELDRLIDSFSPTKMVKPTGPIVKLSSKNDSL